MKIQQRTLRKIHLWLGLSAGLLIVVMSISGSIIVFRPQIESAARPKAISSEVSLALVERSLASAYAGIKITRVTFPASSSDPLLIQAEMADKQRLYEFFDGSSGKELGPQRKAAWLEWIVDLHQNLLTGKTGRALTGVIGGASSKGLIDLANAIHKTELGGMPVRLASSLFGLTPVLLFLSGLLIWWHQRSAALRNKRNARAEEESLVHK